MNRQAKEKPTPDWIDFRIVEMEEKSFQTNITSHEQMEDAYTQSLSKRLKKKGDIDFPPEEDC